MKRKEQIKKQNIIDEELIGNIILKKRITETCSSDKKSLTTTGKYCKINLQQKDIKNFQKDQEQIMLNIENINIENHVQEMLKKFNPPKCSKCDNRTADRVCVNKTCGRNNFMQLICGKCHFKEHQHSIVKLEIDLEEFFIKLATFLNDQKYKKKKSYEFQNAHPESLNKSLDDINRLRQQLNDLKEQLKAEVDDYQRSEKMQNKINQIINYVLAVYLLYQQCIVLESIEEIDEIINYQ